MKHLNLIILFLAATFAFMSASAQNVSINILTQNSGLVSLNGTVFLEVTICNTSASTAVPVYKLRPQLSVPVALVSIPATGHVLPAGWSIISNTAGVIRLSNGTDQLPATGCRTILIALQGNTLGGPSTISGNLLFANGVAPGSTSGGATAGDNSADNTSTSTVEVVNTTPVTLTDFNAVLSNCQPVLNWVTENEINADRFEIEETKPGDHNGWKKIGVVAAAGNSTSLVSYQYRDVSAMSSGEKILYRLKMIDADGNYKYSEVLAVFNNCKNMQVRLYPNPVQKGKLYVSLTGAGNNPVATLMAVSGQLILKSKINNGTNFINTSNVADGMYILTISDANAVTQQVKVFIQN